jgi:3-oxoacyl-[acyl-carrier-protein] synthase-3
MQLREGSMSKLKIIGTGSYLPDLVVTNQMMSEIVETSDEWITSRTGISERHLSSGEPTWHMACEAGRRAVEAAGFDPPAIDMIVVTTVTPDYYTPSIACVVQAELGADRAICFDMNAACSGFVYALDLADRYLNDPEINNILVISAENLSKISDFSDRATCVLFGDGAGAVLCRRNEDPADDSRLLATCLGSEGKQAHFLVARALRVGHPFMKPEDIWDDRYGHRPDHYINMEGQEVYKFAIRVLTESVQNVLDKAGIDLADVRYIIPHQANSRITEASARRLSARPEQMVSRIADFGNTSSASIPICLHELVRDNQLNRGDRVIICGFGGGLTYGAALFVY